MGMSKIDKDWCVDEAQVIITGPIVRNIHVFTWFQEFNSSKERNIIT